MAYGWEGEKVRLVPLDKDKHLENAVRWLNDAEVTAWTLVGDLPMTRFAEQSWFEQPFDPSSTDIRLAIETLDGEHIGFTGIFKINRTHGTAETGILIGPPEYRRKGYGTDTLRVRTRYAFDVLGLRLLTTHAMADNEASCRTIEKAGYQRIGVIPRYYWKRGAYRDVVLFTLERESWKSE